MCGQFLAAQAPNMNIKDEIQHMMHGFNVDEDPQFPQDIYGIEFGGI